MITGFRFIFGTKIKPLLFFWIWIIPFCGFSQDDELQPVKDAASSISEMLGSSENKIEKVRLLSETDQALSVEISFEGFKDKNYKIKGSILSSTKKTQKEVPSVIKDLSKNSNTVELRFTFKQDTKKNYSRSYLESRYLSISMFDARDSMIDFDMGDMNIFGENYLYKLNKKWRISGSKSNSELVVRIKLTPYKSARSINPNR